MAVIFVLLLLRHNKIKYQKNLLAVLLERNQMELRVLHRDFYHLPKGAEYKESHHYFSQDIDLFGRGSFFQYLNRTALKTGADALVHELLSNTIEQIDKKQEAIKELASFSSWTQRFSAVATLVKTEVSAESVVQWLQKYKCFVPNKIKLFSGLFSLLSIIAWTGYFLDFLSGYAVFLWFLIGLGITGNYLKQIGKLAVHTTQIQSTFRQYAELIKLLETKEFSSALLKEKRATIIHQTETSSKIVHKFSKLLDALDQRNNILISIFANGFLLRDLYVCKNIENWIETYGQLVPVWFETIAFFDAYNSLGNYAFNHPNQVYPKIVRDSNITMNCMGAVHPLLDPSSAIPNDFKILKDEFFVITGANMAGKSTFLRTVGLHIVMANMGLPVSAKAMDYSPIKLITSMRTTDSLTDDESYFFSELKRLKMIINAIEKESYFIILDEILKGTNSTDKAVGSKKFIEKLVGLNASGIIATHDLSLCTVADSTNEVKNYYFDAQIKNDELFFDYKFREGICQNMNASFLLKKMGIV
ncbi:MutS-related protein [Croceitalea rosinachiae]|uniref:DNA mismatch repair protein MutS n=1 Tax=Croceitalea rosinachiae TaxID=3075596 RepID=A0ABU3A7D8_9FLAO|nr:DNA mismatch repair protein MutS [Croceitalea sp. F388]MDT0606086.1 DNA mismatch repair protein MutS [Croceitalea sp. F388]